MRWFYLFAVLFLTANMYLMAQGEIFLNAVPLGLILIYTAFYHLDKLFLFIVFFTPLSFNIENYVSANVGLFVPTEPLLFGVLLIIFFKQLKSNLFESAFFKHPITILFIFQLLWIFITAMTSEYPIVSFKFLLMKMWFIIPIYFFGYLFFKDEKNIFRFIWLFIFGLTIVVLYTLINHASYGFNEASGHWVMSPFFKDHTSYGAILALIYPVLFGLLFAKKNGPLVRLILITLILLFAIAIALSYTRAAWLSLVGAFLVYLLFRFKIHFKYLAGIGVMGIVYIAFSWTAIMHNLERNQSEHATDNIDERIESMANISTDASNLERLNRWGSAIRLWEERPIVGWGPGTYAMVYAPFQLSSSKTVISTNAGILGNAHSEYLGPLSEQGLIGMLLIIMLVIYILYIGITLYLRLPEGPLKTLLLTIILGLITYFAHGILNNYLDTDKATIPVWGFTAIIVMLDIKYPKNKIKKGLQTQAKID
ncbi:O-antigen ligase family protein [Crocinitomix catalasitica]|uniref:O-antigen ligase family protein n=1 Tax=Crocinitomix catalasitica TaxID=184607 RepID=UPI0009FFD732|nr:O-antigen ligase family protein [Crocinitomix catalasitica]